MIGACFPFLWVLVTEIDFQNTEQKLCIFVVLSRRTAWKDQLRLLYSGLKYDILL